jgi:membrane protease subunit HflC
VNEGLRNEISKRTLHEVVSGERDLLMADLTKSINTTIGDELGVEVVDVRVKRIDLPDDVSEDVFNRMRTERERDAQRLRSEGKEQAEAILANADRQKIIIEAEAFRESEQIRGEGDARSTSIYADAYNRDREFYSFVRSLQAYRASFGTKNDLMLIDPDGDFFRYLKDSSGAE